MKSNSPLFPPNKRSVLHKLDEKNVAKLSINNLNGFFGGPVCSVFVNLFDNQLKTHSKLENIDTFDTTARTDFFVFLEKQVFQWKNHAKNKKSICVSVIHSVSHRLRSNFLWQSEFWGIGSMKMSRDAV